MPNLEMFKERIACDAHPALPAKEMARKVVVAALEAEYGKTFTFNPHFAKMVDALAEMLVTNPDLRRQTLSVASALFKKQ